MSYSAFFTAGLSLASQPRGYESSFSMLPPFQITVHTGTPPRRTRKRRSSLTMATSPINTIKSPVRAVNDVARNALRSTSPRDGTSRDTLNNGTRPRRKTVSNVKDLPSLPAPTSPLPTIPNRRTDLPRDISALPTPISPVEYAYPSSTIVLDSSRPAPHPGSLRSHPARKSSFLLPMMGRGAIFPGPYAGNNIPDNLKKNLEKDILMDAKNVPAAEWYDEEDRNENVGDV